MAGLFDTISLGSRSLQTQRQGVDTAGHNLANVNTPGYARQRVDIVSVSTPSGTFGTVGAGADVSDIQRIRDTVLDQQITSETSVSGALESRENWLQQALSAFNEDLDRAGSATGALSGSTQGSTHGLSQALSDFFNAAQALSTDPASTADRQVLLDKAQALADQLRSLNGGLSKLSGSIDATVTQQVGQVNDLLSSVARLNDQIGRLEINSPGSANDLRDARQQKLEELSKLVPITATEQSGGSVSISVSGQEVLAAGNSKTLEAFSAPDGKLLLRVKGEDAPLNLTSGTIGGAIEVRDTDLAGTRHDVDTFATALIDQVNQIHSGGFALDGSTGAKFFLGDSSSNITVNPALLGNPALVQTSAAANAADNKAILALAQLAQTPLAGLSGLTFAGKHAQTVASLGQALNSATQQKNDQDLVSKTLQSQRDSISGVSIDEEISNMMKFQKAFEASARFISVADQMLDAVINLQH